MATVAFDPVEHERSDIRLAAFLRYADWAVTLSDSDAVAQLRPFAKDYWIARHWLEDYAARAGAPA